MLSFGVAEEGNSKPRGGGGLGLAAGLMLGMAVVLSANAQTQSPPQDQSQPEQAQKADQAPTEQGRSEPLPAQAQRPPEAHPAPQPDGRPTACSIRRNWNPSLVACCPPGRMRSRRTWPQ